MFDEKRHAVTSTVQEMTESIQIIRDRLETTQSCWKCNDIKLFNFERGEVESKVMDQFSIVTRIGWVTHLLELPSEFRRMRNTLNVSWLEKAFDRWVVSWSFAILERRYYTPSLTPLSSQQDDGFNNSVPSPKDTTEPHGDAYVDPPHMSEQPKSVLETEVRNAEADCLEHPTSTRGSSGSPREGNINTPPEDALHSKATGGPGVGPSGSTRDYVTKAEFQSFAIEVFKRLDKLKSSKNAKIAEALEAHIDALKGVTSTLTEMRSSFQTLQSSILYKEDLETKLNYLSLSDDPIKSIKSSATILIAELVSDLVFAGYRDFSKFKDKIKEMVNSVIAFGLSHVEGNPKCLATRGDLSNLVRALGESIKANNSQLISNIWASNTSVICKLDRLSLEAIKVTSSIEHCVNSNCLNANFHVNEIEDAANKALRVVHRASRQVVLHLNEVMETSCAVEAV
ncbi:hypothetical protein OSB04_024823 [Centaurea solstitialis]|uniref:Uncharacterized protein n=1 Tax=Centaurea solstitialis TaxID=347529 RepID=A0AA38T099_9ASTR|nr:hypothetical protein OSB04_024823 [Centaurea solstitialis]